MIKHPDQRVGVFVDVQNMYYSAKNLYDRHVNFASILKEAVAGRKLIRATAYTIKAQLPEENNFFEALKMQGFEIKSKELQVFPGGVKKGDWDVGIAVDAIKLSRQLDVVVLVTGDGDYLPLVEFLQYHGLLVEIIAFKKTASSKLIERADDYIDLSLNIRRFLMNQPSRGRSRIKNAVHAN
ncbi:MAG: NYN domain-containing protein [Candidatus Jacksonbacteria bacterium]